MKTFIVLLILTVFIVIYNQIHLKKSSKDCLTKERFEALVAEIKKNKNAIFTYKNWQLKYDTQQNRIAFSKSPDFWTLGFVSYKNEKVEVISTIIKAKQNNSSKEEIEKIFCKIAFKPD